MAYIKEPTALEYGTRDIYSISLSAAKSAYASSFPLLVIVAHGGHAPTPQPHPELKILAHDATELEVTPSKYWMGRPNLATIG